MAYKDKNDPRQRASRREWYYRNKEKQKAYKAQRDASLKKWYQDFKETVSCEKCDEDHPACLTFHHRDRNEKEISISKAICDGWSIGRIEAEIAKCDVLCSNCHMKLHWNESH